MTDAPPDPTPPPLRLHWCYFCNTRVAVSSSSPDPSDVTCDVCNNGFVVSMPPPPHPLPSPRQQLVVDDDDDDDPRLSTQFLQVIRLISQAAREMRDEENQAREEEGEGREGEDEARVVHAAANLLDDYHLGRFDFEDWQEDADDRFRDIENQGNLNPVNENQEEVQEDDYGNNNINIDEEEDDEDDDNNENINDIDEDEERVSRWRGEIRMELIDEQARRRQWELELIDEQARRRHRQVLGEGELGAGGVARRNRILDWAEILLGLEDNSVELRLQMPEVDTYVGDPGDYVDATGYEELLRRLAESDNGGRRGAPPASKVVVEGLETVNINSKEEVIVCAVCKDLVDVGELVKRLPCGHRYHGDCIVPWLNTRNSCPICRFELATDDPEYEEERKHKGKAQKGSALGGGSSSTTTTSHSGAGAGGDVE